MGSTFIPSFFISKWRWVSSAISNLAVFPTVAIVCPCSISSPTFTNSAVNKLEYMLSNPFSCSITTVRPYLGSFFIDLILPFADAFTTSVFSAAKSIPRCVVHSSNVLEYIKLSFE